MRRLGRYPHRALNTARQVGCIASRSCRRAPLARPECFDLKSVRARSGLRAACGGGCGSQRFPKSSRLMPDQSTAHAGSADSRSLLRAASPQEPARRCHSVVAYLALSVVLHLTLGVSVLLTVALVVLTAGFLVRTFVVFHDCGHGSLFSSKRANRWVGRFAGCWCFHRMTLAARPCGASRQLGRSRASRHRDIVTLTVDEYRARSPRRSTGVPVDTQSVGQFGIGPIVAMVVGPRSPLALSVAPTQQCARDRCMRVPGRRRAVRLIGWTRCYWLAPSALLAEDWDLAVLRATPVRDATEEQRPMDYTEGHCGGSST